MTDKKHDEAADIAAHKSDDAGSLSAPEREALGQSYRKPEDFPADEKITPPAIQTGAVNPTPVGEPAFDTDIQMPDDANKEQGTQGDTESVTKTGKAK